VRAENRIGAVCMRVVLKSLAGLEMPRCVYKNMSIVVEVLHKNVHKF